MTPIQILDVQNSVKICDNANPGKTTSGSSYREVEEIKASINWNSIVSTLTAPY